MKRVGIYTRCSSDGQSTDLQISDLKKYAELRGWKVVDIYNDHAESGARDDRPELTRLIRDAKARTIDIVLVWKMDRLGRRLVHLVNTIELLNQLGVLFVSFKDSIDATTPHGKLMMHLMAALAEFEREQIALRTKAGRAYAKERGRKFGRPQLRNDHRILELRDQGLTIREIAKLLDLSKSTVGNSLCPESRTSSK